MKKLRIILFIVLSSFALHANSFESQNIQQKGCEEVLGAALFNGVLEDVCGFDGNVKERLKKFMIKINAVIKFLKIKWMLLFRII